MIFCFSGSVSGCPRLRGSLSLIHLTLLWHWGIGATGLALLLRFGLLRLLLDSFRFREKAETVPLLVDNLQSSLVCLRIEPQLDLELFDQAVDLRVDFVRQILRGLKLSARDLT